MSKKNIVETMNIIKATRFDNLIKSGQNVLVSFRTDIPGFKPVIPVHLKHKKVLSLMFGLNMEIPDLQYDEIYVAGTLFFNGQSLYCVIPWGCVCAIADHTGAYIPYTLDESDVCDEPTQVFPLSRGEMIAEARGWKLIRGGKTQNPPL